MNRAVQITLLSAALLGACAQPASEQKTAILPADGGEVGKAYLASLSGEPNEPKDITGGRQQGDYATIFLHSRKDADGDIFVFRNAQKKNGQWTFERQLDNSYGTVFGRNACAGKTTFPCAITTAPDSVVSGTVTMNKYDDFVYKAAPNYVLIDGFAVRRLADNGKLERTTLFLSQKGLLADTILTYPGLEPGNVRNLLTSPLLQLEIEPDGKKASATVWHNNESHQAKLDSGLNIEQNDAKRIKGRLQIDSKELAKINVYFDVATSAVCFSGGIDCAKAE